MRWDPSTDEYTFRSRRYWDNWGSTGLVSACEQGGELQRGTGTEVKFFARFRSRVSP